MDQSGGSTPRALAAYGVILPAAGAADAPGTADDDMFRIMHDMRTRIVTSEAFDGNRVVGAILFEDTAFRRRVNGVPTATYLHREKNVVPFLKIDKGLEPTKNGVQLLKPIPGLAQLLAKCGGEGGGGPGEYIFGTKVGSYRLNSFDPSRLERRTVSNS